jgi:ubiquinone/menaquinone biosynthesis C-methylase UbiE
MRSGRLPAPSCSTSSCCPTQPHVRNCFEGTKQPDQTPEEALVTAPAPPPDDDYILGRTSEEYQRLRWQARLWEPTTARVLDKVGVGPGMRCLDVGCGPGEVMRLMAERVGASGQVTGVDNDGRLGREALEILRATVPGRFEFAHADVEATDELPGGPFDLVYARILLTHLHDPVAMLRRLYTWTRPGGVMLIQDYDASAGGVWPPLATWEEFERVYYGVLEKAGKDPWIGRKLPLHFAAAGVGEPDGTDVAGLLRPLAEVGGMFEAVYQSLRPMALRFGLTTEADGEAFLAEISDAAREGRGVGMAPLLVSVWKGKPPEPDTRPAP